MPSVRVMAECRAEVSSNILPKAFRLLRRLYMS
uniref:Uncharacterized protein n=1 Tax=Siphoviridae sp. ctsUY14 TaxID=2825693 RepID=A0A8S5P5U3_9CAUD|nr:MAG TPA: hypothetical protein [Siphoviridae sp. ctsUY14]